MARSLSLLLATATACSSASTPPPPAGGGCRFAGAGLGGTPDPPAPDPSCISIATINPLSGALGPVGFSLENAARLAARDVNQAGGIGGRRLCLVACDDRTDPSGVPALVNGLLAEHSIVAVNGAAASASSLEAAKVLGPRGIAQVSCCSTSPALTADPTVFRTVPSDALQGVVLANVAKNLQPPATRAAVIYVDDAYGGALRQVFEQAFARLGGMVERTAPYRPGASSYFDVLGAALAGDPSHVVLIAFPTDGAQIMRDWRDSGLAPRTRWLATDGLRDEKFVQGAGGLAAGVVGTAPLLRGARYQSFEQRYREAFGGESPGIFNSNQYDAMMLIALGIARAGAAAPPSQIRDAIREVSGDAGPVVSPDDVAGAIAAATAGDVDYSGASGEVDLDAQGDVISDYGVWEVVASSLRDRPDCWRCQLAAGGTVECLPRGC